jgi:hypothetical protein
VLLPNYITSPSNCLGTTSFFDMCCPNECQPILEHFEKAVEAPEAGLSALLAAATRLPAGHGLEGGVPALVRAGLAKTVAAHGGKVPIHGFAFAQWLHRAFPLECPRPRLSDFATASWGAEMAGTDKEFQATADLRTLKDITASKEELELEKVQLEALASTGSSPGSGAVAPEAPCGGGDGLSPGVCALAALAAGPSTIGSPAAEPLDADLNFLRPERLERALFAEVEAVLAGSHAGVAKGRVAEIQRQMGPIFASLPKNATTGGLQHAAARYALFQRFARRRGWYVRSLNPVGEAQAPSSPGEALRGHVPVHLLTLLEERRGTGLSLQDLAAVVATLEHLIAGDMGQRLKAAYYAHRLSPSSTLDTVQASEVIKTLMAHFVSMEHRSGYALAPEEAQKERLQIEKTYPGWNKITSYIERGLRRLAADQHGAPLALADALAVTKEVMDRYEEQSASECVDIKKELSAFPDGKSGRVKLADLHRAALEGQGTFRESTDYLRKVGALDETDPRSPKVMVPNYVYSPSNCLGTTSFFDICCPNECDLILEHLEQSLQAPAAPAKKVSASLASLPAELRPRKALEQVLRGELDEIALGHNGSVPLHGRAFLQWLHTAFPLECPRPLAEAGEEVPETEKEYQAVADLSSLEKITASTEELLVEEKTLEAHGSSNVTALPAIEEGSEFGLGESLMRGKLAAALPNDVLSFAQTGVEPALGNLRGVPDEE